MSNNWIKFVKNVQQENNISYKESLILSKELYSNKNELVYGGNLQIEGKILRPFFNRVGSKVPILNDVLNAIPEHSIYVEPFVGGGAVFWNKMPAKKSYINDLDKELMEGYKLLKTIPNATNMNYFDNDKTQRGKYIRIGKFIDAINGQSSPSEKLLAIFKKYGGTFNSNGRGQIYKNPSIQTKMENIESYKYQLKNTTISSTDYVSLIHKYDSPTTFFFLDPPYEDSKGLYMHHMIDFNKMRDLLKLIKGKFLLTINDSKFIRNVFKEFFIKPILVKSINRNIIEKIIRKELFITNYHIK